LESYKVDRTFRMQSPDNIDPDRTKPDVPWSWRITDDVGAANPIVGRVFIQCAAALQNKTLRRGDAEKIKVALHTCKEDLRNCERAFLRLTTEYEQLLQQVQSAGGVRIERRVVNNLPQISNLEHDVTIFLTSAKRALQSIAELLNEFYGTTISNARFDRGKTQLKAAPHPPKEVLDVLEQFTPMIERVLHLRNFQEHTPKKTVVENFTLTADAILPPLWRVEPEGPREILPELRDTIGDLINLAELVFFHGLMDNLDVSLGPFQYVVEEIPQAERQGAALRYRCELKFATIQGSESVSEGKPPTGSQGSPKGSGCGK
jgi:hypothetical protein